MSSPMRQARGRSHAQEDRGSPSCRINQSRLSVSRIANTLPTYDFISGNNASTSPVQSLRNTLRRSHAPKADIGNEDLRAQIKTLQYELDSFKQERELTNLRHEKELRDAHIKAEADFKRAQVSESNKHVTTHKYETLSRELKEVKDQAINQRQDLEKQLRCLQEDNRSLREDLDQGQTDLSSLDRQYKHQLQVIESKHATLQRTLNDLQSDLENKSAALQTTQEKLSQKVTAVGHLESEIIRLKAQTGDVETLAVIKKELTETVAHIRKLESTNRSQSTELRQYRRNHKAVEIVEEEKRLLERKLSLMEDLRKDLREAQLQRQMLEDERKSWATYLQNASADCAGEKFESPEAIARTLVEQRLDNMSLVEKLGAMKPELIEKDEIIKSLEDERNVTRAEMDKLRSAGGGSDIRAKARLERQRALAIKEVEYLREQLRTFDTEEITFHSENQFDEQKSKRIQDLESLVDNYRSELHSLNQTLSIHGDENGNKINNSKDTSCSSPTSLKRPLSDEPSDERLGQLSRKNRTLADTLSVLQKKHALLQTDYATAVAQLSALKKTSQTRVLSLRENPTAIAEAIKLSSIIALREENEALLVQLENRSDGATPTQFVPMATLTRTRQDIQALQAVVKDKDKSLRRHMEAWSKTGHSLRLAVASLLGWKMDPTPGGKYRFTSVLPTGGDGDEESGAEEEVEKGFLMFDGEGGKMIISGGPEGEFGRDISGFVAEWVDRRKSIPAFMAALTLDFYERNARRGGSSQRL